MHALDEICLTIEFPLIQILKEGRCHWWLGRGGRGTSDLWVLPTAVLILFFSFQFILSCWLFLLLQTGNKEDIEKFSKRTVKVGLCLLLFGNRTYLCITLAYNNINMTYKKSVKSCMLFEAISCYLFRWQSSTMMTAKDF